MKNKSISDALAFLLLNCIWLLLKLFVMKM